MSTLAKLLAEKTALEKQIEEIQTAGRTNAIATIQTLMADHGLTAADLGAKGPKTATTKAGVTGKVAAKYRNTATGDSWSGRGLQPKWLKAAVAAGRKVEEFAV